MLGMSLLPILGGLRYDAGDDLNRIFGEATAENISARAAHTRPTTVAAQAAVWGREGSEEVLDWLGVSERVYPLEDPAEAPITPEMLVPETPSAALNETRVPAPGLWNRIRTNGLRLSGC